MDVFYLVEVVTKNDSWLRKKKYQDEREQWIVGFQEEPALIMPALLFIVYPSIFFCFAKLTHAFSFF